MFGGRPFEDITMDDVRSLITDRVREDVSLDYKQELKIGTSGERKDFLADVSAFANTSGGYLIIGMTEETNPEGRGTGFPGELIGIIFPEPNEQMERRLISMISDGISPRIASYKVRFLDIDENKRVGIIYISKSWASPHMVNFEGSSRFYLRFGAQKIQLDVQQIRAEFLQSENFQNKIRDFRFDRISKISANEIPTTLNVGPKIIIHFVPLDFLVFSVDINRLIREDIRLIFPSYPDYIIGGIKMINYDGMMIPDPHIRNSRYYQIYRNGIIEYVCSTYVPTDHPDTIPSMSFTGDILHGIKNAVKIIRDYNINLPYFILIDLVGFKDYKFIYSQSSFSNPFDRNFFMYPEIYIDNNDFDVIEKIRPTLNHIWQSVGEHEFPFMHLLEPS
jgi:hypothetical protein